MLGFQKDGRDQAADGHAQNGAAGRVGNIVGQPFDHQCRCQTHQQLAHSFQHLADGGGTHVPLALEKAPVGGNNAHQQGAGAQDRNCQPCIRLPLEACQLMAKQHHGQTADNAQTQKDAPGCAVHLPHLPVMPQGAGLADHAAHSHRKACRGDHQQHGIDIVSGHEVAVAGITDDHFQRDLIQRADDLYHRCGNGKQSRAMEECLLFSGF